jgi:hypothetical protein
MTNQEAEKVLRILCSADGGCPYCAKQLIEHFCKQFDGFGGLAIKIFDEAFGEDYPDIQLFDDAIFA